MHIKCGKMHHSVNNNIPPLMEGITVLKNSLVSCHCCCVTVICSSILVYFSVSILSH